MNTCKVFLAFLALSLTAQAATPKELTSLQQQYASLITERVTGPYETGIETLNTKFAAALEKAVAEAQTAGNLPAVLAIEEDRKRIAGKLPLPDTDDEKTPEALKKLRAIYREQLAKITEARSANQAGILPGYLAKLQALEVTLTKAARVDEAKEVMTYREGLVANPTLATPTVTTPPASATTPASPAKAAAKTPRIKGDDRRAAEWVLSNWTDFRLAIDGNKQVRTKDDLPKGRFAIESLAIDGRAFTGGTMTGEALQVLAGLEGLKTFTFGRFPDLKDADMAFLSSLPALEELKLNNLRITDAVVPLLANNRNLKKFDVGEIPSLTGITLDQLAKTGIDTIIFWKCGLTDEGVAKIALLPDVKVLDIQSHTGVTNASIPHLRAMPALTNLFIASTKITPDGFGGAPLPKITHFAGNNLAGLPLSDLAPKLATVFPNVTSFTLSHFANTPEDLAALANFKALTKLVNAGSIKDEALQGLLELRDLQSYQVVSAGISDATLETLAKLKKVKSLRYGSKPPSEAALAAFKKARPDVMVEK